MPARADLRPTPDRVRETLFNWLQATLPGAACLDLFAGSGALGFEAASRGAQSVTLVEQDRDQAALLRDQVKVFQADNVNVVQADALQWLAATDHAFDIILLDPPFSSDLLESCLTILANRAILRPSGLTYVEQAKGQAVPDGWQVMKSTHAGRVEARLLQLAAKG